MVVLNALVYVSSEHWVAECYETGQNGSGKDVISAEKDLMHAIEALGGEAREFPKAKEGTFWGS